MREREREREMLIACCYCYNFCEHLGFHLLGYHMGNTSWLLSATRRDGHYVQPISKVFNKPKIAYALVTADGLNSGTLILISLGFDRPIASQLVV